MAHNNNYEYSTLNKNSELLYTTRYNMTKFKGKSKIGETRDRDLLYTMFLHRSKPLINKIGSFGKSIIIDNPDYKELDRNKYNSLWKYKLITDDYFNTNYSDVYSYNNNYTIDEWDYVIKHKWADIGPSAWWDTCDHSEIYDYLDIVPWDDKAIMININPDWVGS